MHHSILCRMAELAQLQLILKLKAEREVALTDEFISAQLPKALRAELAIDKNEKNGNSEKNDHNVNIMLNEKSNQNSDKSDKSDNSNVSLSDNNNSKNISKPIAENNTKTEINLNHHITEVGEVSIISSGISSNNIYKVVNKNLTDNSDNKNKANNNNADEEIESKSANNNYFTATDNNNTTTTNNHHHHTNHTNSNNNDDIENNNNKDDDSFDMVDMDKLNYPEENAKDWIAWSGSLLNAAFGFFYIDSNFSSSLMLLDKEKDGNISEGADNFSKMASKQILGIYIPWLDGNKFITGAANNLLLSKYNEAKFTIKRLHRLTGVDRRLTAVIAIKLCGDYNKECMLSRTTWDNILDAFDDIAQPHRITCIRKFGDMWIGCVGFFDSWKTSGGDCYYAIEMTCAAVKLCNEHNLKICCAVDYGTVVGGFINDNFSFDLVGQEVRWVISMAELKQHHEIYVSVSAKTHAESKQKRNPSLNVIKFYHPTICNPTISSVPTAIVYGVLNHMKVSQGHKAVLSNSLPTAKAFIEISATKHQQLLMLRAKCATISPNDASLVCGDSSIFPLLENKHKLFNTTENTSSKSQNFPIVINQFYTMLEHCCGYSCHNTKNLSSFLYTIYMKCILTYYRIIDGINYLKADTMYQMGSEFNVDTKNGFKRYDVTHEDLRQFLTYGNCNIKTPKFPNVVSDVTGKGNSSFNLFWFFQGFVVDNDSSHDSKQSHIESESSSSSSELVDLEMTIEHASQLAVSDLIMHLQHLLEQTHFNNNFYNYLLLNANCITLTGILDSYHYENYGMGKSNEDMKSHMQSQNSYSGSQSTSTNYSPKTNSKGNNSYRNNSYRNNSYRNNTFSSDSSNFNIKHHHHVNVNVNQSTPPLVVESDAFSGSTSSNNTSSLAATRPVAGEYIKDGRYSYQYMWQKLVLYGSYIYAMLNIYQMFQLASTELQCEVGAGNDNVFITKECNNQDCYEIFMIRWLYNKLCQLFITIGLYIGNIYNRLKGRISGRAHDHHAYVVPIESDNDNGDINIINTDHRKRHHHHHHHITSSSSSNNNNKHPNNDLEAVFASSHQTEISVNSRDVIEFENNFAIHKPLRAAYAVANKIPNVMKSDVTILKNSNNVHEKELNSAKDTVTTESLNVNVNVNVKPIIETSDLLNVKTTTAATATSSTIRNSRIIPIGLYRGWNQYLSDIHLLSHKSLPAVLGWAIFIVISWIALTEQSSILDSARTASNYVTLTASTYFIITTIPFLFERHFYSFYLRLILLFGRCAMLYMVSLGNCSIGIDHVVEYNKSTNNNNNLQISSALNKSLIKLLLILLSWLPLAMNSRMVYNALDIITMWIILIFKVNYIHQYCKYSYITLEIIAFLFIFISLYALLWVMQYHSLVAYYLEHKILPVQHKVYIMQKEQTNHIIAQCVASKSLPIPNQNIESMLLPKRYVNCSIAVIHIKLADILPGLVPSKDLSRLLNQIFRLLDNCCMENGLKKVSQFSGTYIAAICAQTNDANDTASSIMPFAENLSVSKSILALRNILKRLTQYNELNEVHANFGIGVCQGSCTIGVLGQNRSCFDCSGDSRDRAYVMAIHEADGALITEDFVNLLPLRMIQPHSTSKLNDDTNTYLTSNTSSDIKLKHSWVSGVVRVSLGSNYITCCRLKFDTGLNAMRLDDFEHIRLLGRGGYGSVHLVREIATNEEYAIKTVPREQAQHTSKLITSEISILQRLHHPNVVEFKYCMMSKSQVYIVMSYIKGGNLRQLCERLKPDISILIVWFAELILALEC
jgi:hypothetical protein